jgi:hypothetical protein
MRFKITDEEKWLRRLAGMPLQEEGLRQGPQCLICRSWSKDKKCDHCRKSQEIQVVASLPKEAPKLDLDELIRKMRRKIA